MKLVLLSLLLVGLVALAMLVGFRESFEDSNFSGPGPASGSGSGSASGSGPGSASVPSSVVIHDVSPTLKNMLESSSLVLRLDKKPTVDALARDMDAVKSANSVFSDSDFGSDFGSNLNASSMNQGSNQQAKRGKSKRCNHPSDDDAEPEQEPHCPDMSKYIRMDEVPCWNCSLP
jgi:hypothetical protein